MIHILRIIAVIVAITYSLHLVNSRSDLLVFGGLAIVGISIYFLFIEFRAIFNQLKSKL